MNIKKTKTKYGTFYINEDGFYHRLNGPAIENLYGIKGWESYFINGIQYDEQKYWIQICKMGIITEEELFIKLL